MVAVFVVCLMNLTLANAATGDWTAVQALVAGQRVQVDLSSGKMLKGKIDHVTPESVFVRSGRKLEEVQRKDISHLYIKKKGGWWKSTLFDMAIGAGAAGGIGAAIMEHERGYGGAVAGTVALFAGIGAAVGYALRPDQTILVYEATSAAR